MGVHTSGTVYDESGNIGSPGGGGSEGTTTSTTLENDELPSRAIVSRFVVRSIGYINSAQPTLDTSDTII